MEASCKECGALYNIEGTDVPVNMKCLCKCTEFKVSEAPTLVIA